MRKFSIQFINFHLCAFTLLCNYQPVRCDNVEDHIRLINHEIEKSKRYKPPQDNEDMYPDNLADEILDFGAFEFIVVGAGSAGAIVAKRLSDNKYNTLLIEAGGPETDFTDIPAAVPFVLNSEFVWPYFTTPQTNICLGFPNKSCALMRGKSLGGSSTVNMMWYVRGNELDQSYWQDFGVTGWSWEDVLRYYKRVEDYSNINSIETSYHGQNGQVPINEATPSNYLVRPFLKAFHSEIGDLTDDINGKKYMAAGKMQYTKKNGKRASTGRCYLRDVNSYLTISTKSFAYKILFNSDKKRACGIEFVKDNIRYRATSKKELILSAGYINTPHLLMMSGIGPREHLLQHNIPLIQDLPVGQNYEDHFALTLHFDTPIDYHVGTYNLEEAVWNYISGTGRLANYLDSAVAFVSTENKKDYPDIELAMFVDQSLSSSKYFQGGATTEGMYNLFSVVVVLMHPNSRGQVTLRSDSPKDYPILDPISKFDPNDWETMYKGVKHVLKIVNSDVFKEYNLTLAMQKIPACEELEYLSKDYWICMIQHFAIPAWHGCGTCRMGWKNSSVVDSRLRVYGVKNLRIIDTSVIPRVNSGHLNAVAMMVGEKGADLVKLDHPRKNTRSV